MYLEDYLWYLVAIFICMMFSAWASFKVHSTYSKYGKKYNRSGMTGYDTAVRLMRSNGISDVTVGRVSGHLTDHYNPAKQIVNLSESTFGSDSIAAVAVAAHEVGHVVQNKKGYLFYRIRTAIFPIVNIGSRLAMPLVIVGLLIDLLALSANEGVGFYVAMVGVVLYAFAFLFTLVTLPVELNASNRAKKMLIEHSVLTQEELKGASKVLTSFVYFLRFLLMVLTIFGRRNNRR